MSAPDSILKKALEFLERSNTPIPTSPTTPVEEAPEEQLTPTHSYALLEEFPNLIIEDHQIERVVEWLRVRDHVALDIETYGHARRKEVFRKEALSFVKGTIRLIQLSDSKTTFMLDARVLTTAAVVTVLGELAGKSLYLHNAIFDLPRILRTFGVDLLGEDIRDTLILSRLLRCGQWSPDGDSATINLRHDIKSILHRELGIRITKETDHRWDEPLTPARLQYAAEDVEHLIALYEDLLGKVEKDGMLAAYKLLVKVYPVYLRQQVRGVPFDVELYHNMRGRLQEKLVMLQDQLREHAPEHPDKENGGKWVWRNNRKPEEKEGRNGALRALAMAGTPLPDLQKPTRTLYLTKYENAPLLAALDRYLKFADLESDTRDWIDFYYEDGRLYPNVRFFSQV